VLEQLGTTAIKLGQIASTRPDLLPPEVIAELEKLRDRVPPVATDAIVEVVERELRCKASKVFSEFDEVPLALASIGQVHAARVADGSPVVVKVRKPGVAETVAADLAILAGLARRASPDGPARGYDLEALAGDFAWTLRRELDYVREGRNADRLRASLAGEPRMVVPKIHWPLTTEAMLVMERIEGTGIGDLARLDAKASTGQPWPGPVPRR
jgi:ubiquinone biosynthesis protein